MIADERARRVRESKSELMAGILMDCDDNQEGRIEEHSSLLLASSSCSISYRSPGSTEVSTKGHWIVPQEKEKPNTPIKIEEKATQKLELEQKQPSGTKGFMKRQGGSKVH